MSLSKEDQKKYDEIQRKWTACQDYDISRLDGKDVGLHLLKAGQMRQANPDNPDVTYDFPGFVRFPYRIYNQNNPDHAPWTNGRWGGAKMRLAISTMIGTTEYMQMKIDFRTFCQQKIIIRTPIQPVVHYLDGYFPRAAVKQVDKPSQVDAAGRPDAFDSNDDVLPVDPNGSAREPSAVGNVQSHVGDDLPAVPNEQEASHAVEPSATGQGISGAPLIDQIGSNVSDDVAVGQQRAAATSGSAVHTPANIDDGDILPVQNSAQGSVLGPAQQGAAAVAQLDQAAADVSREMAILREHAEVFRQLTAAAPRRARDDSPERRQIRYRGRNIPDGPRHVRRYGYDDYDSDLDDHFNMDLIVEVIQDENGGALNNDPIPEQVDEHAVDLPNPFVDPIFDQVDVPIAQSTSRGDALPQQAIVNDNVSNASVGEVIPGEVGHAQISAAAQTGRNLSVIVETDDGARTDLTDSRHARVAPTTDPIVRVREVDAQHARLDTPDLREYFERLMDLCFDAPNRQWIRIGVYLGTYEAGNERIIAMVALQQMANANMVVIKTRPDAEGMDQIIAFRCT